MEQSEFLATQFQFKKGDISLQTYWETEMKVLNHIQWKLNEYTPFDFAEAYMAAGVVFEGDVFEESLSQRRADGDTMYPSKRSLKKGAKNLNKLIKVLVRLS